MMSLQKIHQSQHEGRVKLDMALVAAENLLESGDEELRNHTHAKLKDLKTHWEETSTYITHCHRCFSIPLLRLCRGDSIR